MMHNAGLNDMLKKGKVGLESYFSSVTRSEDLLINVLFPQGPYWFCSTPSDREIALTWTSSSRFWLIFKAGAAETVRKLHYTN